MRLQFEKLSGALPVAPARVPPRGFLDHGRGAATGCGGDAKTSYTSVSEPPTVRIIRPSVRNIVRVVGQPSFIESYERTSIFPKLTAYIEKWMVDIGDRVKKGDVLATLFVPEVVEDFGTKNATVSSTRNESTWPARSSRWPMPTSRRPRRAWSRPRRHWASPGRGRRWDSQVKRIQREVERAASPRRSCSS